MFQKILFATSATEACDHAARVAFDMADRYQSHLTVFHVLGVPTRAYSQVVVDIRTGDKVILDDDYRSWVEEEVKIHYAKQLETAPETSIEVAVGLPHREILRKARDTQPDLIVMGGSTGRDEESAYKRSVAGSTLQRVAKVAACPVLVITRPAASFWGGFSNVVFGTDFSRASDNAFDFAVKLARQLNCDLHLFHALDISAMHAGKLADQDEIEDQIRAALKQMRRRYLKRVKDLPNISIEVWEGLPYVEIVKYAREKQADLIVMAHHTSAAQLGEARLGSVMEQVMVRAGCPVISVNRSIS